MHDVQIQIRCQRCGNQMELKDPGPDDAWTPQQFWECQACGRHFWTTYPPPKKPAPPKAAKPAPPESDAAPQARPATAEAKSGASASPPQSKTAPEAPSKEQAGAVAEKPVLTSGRHLNRLTTFEPGFHPEPQVGYWSLRRAVKRFGRVSGNGRPRLTEA